MTGITRETAARSLSVLWNTQPLYKGGSYYAWEVADPAGKKWKIMSDSTIKAQKKQGRQYISTDDDNYKVEMVTPILTYPEMEKLQEVVRCLRHAGAVVGDQCGMHYTKLEIMQSSHINIK